MKSAVFYGKHDLRVEERALPVIGPKDVLIQVKACGVCGTFRNAIFLLPIINKNNRIINGGRKNLRAHLEAPLLSTPFQRQVKIHAEIQVKACGVCGTDVHIYEGDKGAAEVTPPTILGHEFSGIVKSAFGSAVTVHSVPATGKNPC